ncbi:lactococcin 972 family bacteriocin [Apilactobacillus quenuiae]|uniref:lactococcin 972 family bacteriocin n=1 Tax=Apilactobacillus quenuiae TaxID=2008377 RepID=UPI000D020167|nr:lactococcin 972 family bacteriocin [Apilactobacillus quenuiae]
MFKISKKIILSFLTIATLGIGLSSIANASHVGGGNWTHGIGSKYVWSNYSHNHRYHSSAVSGQYYASSGKTVPRYTAKASAPKSWWGNKAYYNYW